MAEDWDKFWENESISKKIVAFMRHNYFSNVVASYIRPVENREILEAGCGTCESLVKIARKAKIGPLKKEFSAAADWSVT
mgnify:CR=1 FL=1